MFYPPQFTLESRHPHLSPSPSLIFENIAHLCCAPGDRRDHDPCFSAWKGFSSPREGSESSESDPGDDLAVEDHVHDTFMTPS